MQDQKILKKVGFLVMARDLAVEYGEETKLKRGDVRPAGRAGRQGLDLRLLRPDLSAAPSGPGTGSWCPGAGSARAAPPALEIATRPRRGLSARMGG